MIPKTIHYCWFGRGEKPKLVCKCIDSWKKYCPDYEIIEWNEDNFDTACNEYVKSAYEQKKYAFLTDYARLKIIYENGGIYFDTDVEVIRSFDDLLLDKAFIGFEDREHVNTGMGFGAEQKNIAVLKMLQEYDHVIMSGDFVGCPILNTSGLLKCGLILNGQTQRLDEISIYGKEYFNPYDDPTGRLNITQKTYSIHWYAKSWMSKKTILRSKVSKPIHRLFSKKTIEKDYYASRETECSIFIR